MSQFDRQVRALRDMARDAGAVELVNAMADEWVGKAQRVAPKDTWFMHDHMEVVERGSGTASRATATVQSRANYSGFVEYGTRYMAPQPFWRPGRDAAERLANAAEGQLRTSVERAVSGGLWRPPDYKSPNKPR